NTRRTCLNSGGRQHSLDFLVFGIAYAKNDFVSMLRPTATERAADIACSDNCYFHLAPFLVSHFIYSASLPLTIWPIITHPTATAIQKICLRSGFFRTAIASARWLVILSASASTAGN